MLQVGGESTISKYNKISIASSEVNSKGFMRELSVSKQNSANSSQESPISFATIPHLQVATLIEVLSEAGNQLRQHTSQIIELKSKINQENLLNNSTEIVEYISFLIHLKELSARSISWMSVVTNIAHYLVITFDEYIPDDSLNNIEKMINSFEKTFDTALTDMPSGSVLGITFAPDQKQVSESKAVISDILSRIEKIKQENEEAAQDWGPVEQEAYEAILEGSTKNVSGEEFFDWLSELERGGEV